MTDFTPTDCTSSPALNKIACDGNTVIDEIPADTSVDPPVITDPEDVDEGIDPPTDPGTDIPHDPPTQTLAAEVNFFAIGEIVDSPNQFSVTLCDPDDPGMMAGTGVIFDNTTWDWGSAKIKVGNLMVSEDGLNCWHLNQQSSSGQYDMILVHWDMTNPSVPVKSYEKNIHTELGGIGTGNDRIECFSSCFYSDITKRIYIAYHFIDQLKNGLAIYDVSNPTSVPVLISKTNLPDWGSSHRIFGLEVSHDESYVFVGGYNSTVSPVIHSASVSADGVTVTYQSTLLLSGGTPAGIRLRRLNAATLLVTAAPTTHRYLYSIDITTPTLLTIRDTLDLGAINVSAEPGSIAISTDNTRAYIHISTNGSGAAIAVCDVTDRDNLVLLSSNYNLDSIVINDYYGDRLHYVESDRDLDPYLIALTSGASIQSIDVSSDLALTLIDTGGSPEDADNIGCARGPKTFRMGSEVGGGTAPIPVDANLAVVSGTKTPFGVAVICGLDDYENPTADVTVRETDLFDTVGLGPYSIFTHSGRLAILNDGVLKLYTNGSTFALAGTLSSSSLANARGLVASKIDEKLWTMVENSIVEIDVSTPAAPSITSVTNIGPSYFNDDIGGQKVLGVTDNYIIIEHDGPGLVSQTTHLRTGWTRPLELINCKAITIDSTYAYVWNDYGGGGFAVFKYGVDTMDFVGYLDVGSREGYKVKLLKSGNYVYCLFSLSTASVPGLLVIDISDPTSPTIADTYDVEGVAIGSVSASELVIFGSTLVRLNITVPTAVSVTASLVTGRNITSGAIVNGKAVAFDSNKNAIGYSLGSPIVEQSTVSLLAVGNLEAYGVTYAGKDYVVVGQNTPTSSIPAVMVVNATTIGSISIASQVAKPFGQQYSWAFNPTTQLGFYGGQVIDFHFFSAPIFITETYNPDTELSRDRRFAMTMTGSTVVVGRHSDIGGILVIDISTISSPTTTRSLGDRSVSKRVGEGRIYHIRGTDTGVAVGFSPPRICKVLTTNGEPRIGSYTSLPLQGVSFGGAALDDSGSYLFFAYANTGIGTSDWGIRVYDVSDPSSAVLLSNYSVARGIYGVKVSGTSRKVIFLYKNAAELPVLAIVDFTDLYNPVLLGEVIVYEAKLNNLSLETY